MTDSTDVTPDLLLQVERKLREEREQREPVGGAWGTVCGTLTLFAITIYVEWTNINLALGQLFPVLSDGTGAIDGAAVLAFASIIGILLADIMLDRAAERWPDRVKRWVVRLGIVAVVIFTLAAMVLIPLSIMQANDPSATYGEGFWVQGSYVSFGVMLAALLPLSVLAGFSLLQLFKPAWAKIERAKAIDARISHARGLLVQHEAALAERRNIERQLADVLTYDVIADRYAVEASAIIGGVAGRVRHVISLREAADHASTDEAPLKATGVPWLDAAPLEKLREMFTYLSSFAPANIRQRLTS